MTNEVLDPQSRSVLASVALPFGDVTNHSAGHEQRSCLQSDSCIGHCLLFAQGENWIVHSYCFQDSGKIPLAPDGEMSEGF